MNSWTSTTPAKRRAYLVGICLHETREEAASLLDELRQLVETLGIVIVGQTLVRMHQAHARFFVGTGKADEIMVEAQKHQADVVIFDSPISPGQQRNWEKLSKLAVIDREEVILDIFDRRAQTKEARLQVELARMEYSLPRLTRAWTHLSRQGGSGFGAMGAGETQLETDRRLVRKRIDTLKAELSKLLSQRATRRKQRQRRPTPHTAIVGYTNAGKSSLFRKLTGAEVLVEDKLFATLDTTTRKLELPNGQDLLVTDTVGFVRRLPHSLVESFKATLEESVLAEFLIHVLDSTQEAVLEFHETTMSVLEELGADVKHMITVFNKIDAVSNPATLMDLRRKFPDALFVSALTGEGVEELKHAMVEQLPVRLERAEYLIPQSRYDLISAMHRHGDVLHQDYEGENVRLTASLPPRMLPTYTPFQVSKRTTKASKPRTPAKTGNTTTKRSSPKKARTV